MGGRSGDQQIKSVNIYDGRGRSSETHSYECSSGYISQKTTYDGMGRLGKSSNPYRPVTPCTGGSAETAYWTAYGYDGLNRITNVTTPDGSSTGTSYLGNQATATNPAGVTHANVNSEPLKKERSC